MHVFISYPSELREEASSVKTALKKRGFKTFQDIDDIGSSEDWHGKIRCGVRAAGLYVVLFSKAMQDTQRYYGYEVEQIARALENPSQAGIIVLLGEAGIEDLPSGLKRLTPILTRESVDRWSSRVVEEAVRVRHERRRKLLLVGLLLAAFVGLAATLGLQFLERQQQDGGGNETWDCASLQGPWTYSLAWISTHRN